VGASAQAIRSHIRALDAPALLSFNARSFSRQLLLAVPKRETKMAHKSPLQIVNEKFGSKEELAKKLAEVLEPAPDESKEELAERLGLTSNSKLLHLHALSEKVSAHGGREELVKKIAAAEKKSNDKDYIKALTERRTLGWLVDRVESHERRAAKKAKKSA
jgi:hypothetical protein